MALHEDSYDHPFGYGAGPGVNPGFGPNSKKPGPASGLLRGPDPLVNKTPHQAFLAARSRLQKIRVGRGK